MNQFFKGNHLNKSFNGNQYLKKISILSYIF